MQTLAAYFADHRRDIDTLGAYLQEYLDEHAQPIFELHRAEMEQQYEKIGDAVYGVYGKHLFATVYEQLKETGLRTTPRLPFGGFSASREFGPEEDRQRWFWSKITTSDGATLGTIALAFYHDHVNIRIPRPPRVMALEETSKAAVIAALARISPEFGEALEAKIEITEYLAQLEREAAPAA